MSSLRLELEQAMGLKFPERNGAAIVKFEESLEIPRAAETLMRGLYRDPEGLRQKFKRLHQEAGSIIDLLMPRRSRLREWSDSLPERPKDAEAFLKETKDQLMVREQSLVQVQQELMDQLQESSLDDIFPISLSAFGICTYRDPNVKLFLKPLGRLAEILQLNPESLRQAVRVHFLCLLLIIAGVDLDGQVYTRGVDEEVIHWLASVYTLRYLKRQSGELIQCYLEWVKAWGGKIPNQSMYHDKVNEKTRAAMVFWRRQLNLSWAECWQIINQFEAESSQGLGID
ncbi:hypothetical protein REC12_20860 [Desulfosporosinus sp. PR]|uniref:hypothetical protein n=1 Tax=Candidatus Desulfosporosinus nitrosoreducens TaxID=3401928 RepID=UPI0027F8D815|nr:hypothetical protein [Desulfosporosinus sp. PR]MDQ7096051.1 hypothetical protein [Desulfosporosinus sp. PR]